MGEQPPMPPTTQDFPDHWGFYLLQAINRLDDKIDDVRHRQERTAEAIRQEIGGVRQEIGDVRQEIGDVRQEIGGVRQEIGGVRQEIGGVRQEIGGVRQEIGGVRQEIHALDTKFDEKIEALDTKFDHKLTNLQYWYWSTLIVIIVGFVTVLFTHPGSI